MSLNDILLFVESKYIFLLIIIILILGAVSSLVLHKKHSIVSVLSNCSAVVASFLGLSFSVTKLLFRQGCVSEYTWESNVNNMSISIRIDNLSAFFILVISLLTLIVSIYSIGYMRHYHGKRNLGVFGFLYNTFILSMILVVSSGHVFFFLVVWEIMSFISYFLVVFENEKNETQKAGTMYIIMTHIGTAFIISAFILMYKYTGSAYFSEINSSSIPSTVKNIIFVFCFIGFGTKAGIIPLHVWLPMAHPAAPSNISALMSGVMIKTAVYGIVRVVFCMLGTEYLWWGMAILVIGAISAILGIAFALMENNIKKLLAYSSVENIGIIMIGVGLAAMACTKGNHTVAAFSLTASLLHVLNHSLFKGLLFMGAGSVHYATNTKDMERLGGLIKRMPYTAVFFLAGSLAISAIPPFNGFVSEWMIYQSLFVNIPVSSGWHSMVMIITVAILSMAGVLAASSFIKTFGISFLALPRTNNSKEAKEVPKTMLVGMGISSVLCLVLGVIPIAMIKILEAVNSEVVNATVGSSITGYSSFILFAGEKNSSVSMVALVGVAVLLIPIIILLVKVLSTGTASRRYGTWDCGYKSLNSRMQYTATGFSKPVRIVFRAIYRPKRGLEVNQDASPYFFKTAKYVVSTQSVFEKYLYQPVIKNTVNFARRMRFTIQTGSIHTYLIYIFIVIIAMFVYYAKA